MGTNNIKENRKSYRGSTFQNDIYTESKKIIIYNIKLINLKKQNRII